MSAQQTDSLSYLRGCEEEKAQTGGDFHLEGHTEDCFYPHGHG
jgi:hypothetical protein